MEPSYGEVTNEVFRQWEIWEDMAENLAAVGEYGTEPYAPGTPMTRLVDHPVNRVIEALNPHDEEAVPEPDVARMAGMDIHEAQELPEIGEKLERLGIASRTYDESSNTFYWSMNRHTDVSEYIERLGREMNRHQLQGMIE
ncbi:MAG: hypothetical protein ABEJ03_00900 [Candidatus Nanohaloarchaea archaeon]